MTDTILCFSSLFSVSKTMINCSLKRKQWLNAITIDEIKQKSISKSQFNQRVLPLKTKWIENEKK
jgi:hypothetical protein